MKSSIRYFLFFIYIFGSIGFFYTIIIFLLQITLSELIQDWSFWISSILYIFTYEEFYHWVRNGKRSEMSDIVAILFFLFVILFFTKDILTSIMGAFSIYLWIGIFELKDYPVLNKILIISSVTYNVIFIAGIVSFYLKKPYIINTSFAFSFWIILILGFILFGRKYIVVWRFMSPEYLTLFLYVIAWLAVVILNQYILINTPFNFILSTPFASNRFKIHELFMNIYFVLIVVNWIIYFISGGILDKLLGIRRIKNENLLELIEKVKNDIGIKGNVKAGIGKYPILNAMAYGSFFDKRIAIIADDIDKIPKDELKGIVAHELAHTKGKHTLILTFITTGDLVIRMIFGIPATFYDYTFGNPQIPLFNFIILNIVIYVILFVFVRFLEGKADLKAKNAGYGRELVKALYNLESFYATGREIGLNTMLLSEEKISNENQLLDYFNTASYLYNSIIKPSRMSLLSNLINSHPPSYYRIASILDNKLKPGKEALLPFMCLKKSIQKKYAKNLEPSRNAFKLIANEKFKEYFQISNISLLFHNLKRKEFYKNDLNRNYVFTNKVTDEVIFGLLNDVQFYDDICSIDEFIIKNLKTNETEHLEKALFSYSPVDLDEIYYLNNNEPLILKNITLKGGIEDRNYIFLDKSNNEITKSIKKTKLPNSIATVKDLENKEIFFKTKGTLNIMECVAISPAKSLQEYKLTFSPYNKTKAEDHKQLKYNLKELIIRPKTIFLPISKSSTYRSSEKKILSWLEKNQILIHLYMKKPVNNIEMGYIQQIEMNTEDFSNKMQTEESDITSFLILKNIFDKEVKILYNSIETINFEYNSAMIQLKSETSLFSRLGYKILKKFKPNRIVLT